MAYGANFFHYKNPNMQRTLKITIESPVFNTKQKDINVDLGINTSMFVVGSVLSVTPVVALGLPMVLLGGIGVLKNSIEFFHLQRQKLQAVLWDLPFDDTEKKLRMHDIMRIASVCRGLKSLVCEPEKTRHTGHNNNYKFCGLSKDSTNSILKFVASNDEREKAKNLMDDMDSNPFLAKKANKLLEDLVKNIK